MLSSRTLSMLIDAGLSGNQLKEITASIDEDFASTRKGKPAGDQTVRVNVKQILMDVLSQATAEAVIKHRQSKRAPLTPRAAELLVMKLKAAHTVGLSPDAAADMMIERGWQAFKPEWVKGTPYRSQEQPNDYRGGTMMRIDGGRMVPTTDERWARRMKAYRSDGKWDRAEWGPMPGEPGCNVPSKLLVEAVA